MHGLINVWLKRFICAVEAIFQRWRVLSWHWHRLKAVDEDSNAQYADSDRPFLKDVVEKAVLVGVKIAKLGEKLYPYKRSWQT